MTQRQLKMRRHRAERIAIVGRYKASGLTLDAFAAQAGVNSGRLGWWALRLRRETTKTKEAASPKNVPLSSAAFIPVRVVASAPPPSSPVSVSGVRTDRTDNWVELVVSQGSVMRLDPDRMSERGVALVALLAKELCR